jgi:hypothetical protein
MFRVIQISILAVALSALFAPTAFAERPDDKAGKIGVGSVQPTGATYAHPDDRADARGPGAYEERLPELAPQALVQDDGGFDWAAAGVGALAAFAVAMLFLGGVQVLRRERRHVPA